MKASLNSLHHQATDWLRELDFYQQEIGILTKRLEEVSNKNTAEGIRARVEHFQNKFIMFREQIDTLKHTINGTEHKIENSANAKPTHISEKTSTSNDALLNDMKGFAHDIADTRFEFNTFLSEVL